VIDLPEKKAPRLALRDVTFEYPLFEIAERSLKVKLLNLVRRQPLAAPTVKALRGVSFELRDGDRLGLIGHNGAGKSSLLRLLGGLAHPTSGTIESEGRIIPLIDKGVGINPELSAADNIELPLRLLGATTEEIDHAREDVRAFSDLGDFFDIPVRRYSDGMKARLSFALSTSIPADVLVLDEWLSAGDAAFVQKAQERLTRYLDTIKVVILASHSRNLLKTVCNKVAWLDKGELRAIGPSEKVLEEYFADANKEARKSVGGKVELQQSRAPRPDNRLPSRSAAE
jgi:ABC-2 type transport system ATP-binding protein/lipopolysaccharide transport system ATP-binding protein